jgi:hypothetical protein
MSCNVDLSLVLRMWLERNKGTTTDESFIVFFFLFLFEELLLYFLVIGMVDNDVNSSYKHGLGWIGWDR